VAKSDLKFTGDASQLDRELKKTQRELEKQKQKVRDIGTESKKTEGKQKEAFGTKSQNQLATFALGLVSVAGGAAKIAAAFKKIREERERAAGKVSESEFAVGALSELTGGDAQKLRAVINQSDAQLRAGGALTRTTSAEFTYKLTASGQDRDAALLTSFFGTTADTTTLVAAISALQSAFQEPGAAEGAIGGAGTLKEVLTKGLLANVQFRAPSVKILTAAALGGSLSRSLGISDEAQIAATGLLSETLDVRGELTKGGESLKTFASALLRSGQFKDIGGLEAIIREISGRGLSDPQKFKLLGDTSAVNAFNLLEAGLPKLVRVTQALQVGQTTDVVEDIIASRQQIPELIASRRRRASGAALEITRRPEAIDELLIQSFKDTQTRRAIEQFGETGSFPVRLLTALANTFASLVTTDKTFAQALAQGIGGQEELENVREIQAAAREGRPTTQPIDVNTPALEDVRRNTEALQQNTAAIQGGSQLGGPNEDQGG
jgi:hypothetical protein